MWTNYSLGGNFGDLSREAVKSLLTHDNDIDVGTGVTFSKTNNSITVESRNVTLLLLAPSGVQGVAISVRLSLQ